MVYDSKGKRFFNILLSVLLLLALCGCAEMESLDAGRYLCVAAEADGFPLKLDELYPQGAVLELGSGGKGLLTAGEQSGTIRWSLDGENLRVRCGAERCTGSLRDGVVELIMPRDAVRLRFVREDLVSDMPSAPAPETYEAAAARWCGDWFGRWSLRETEGSFPETWYDCCATITMEDGGERVLLCLWDEDGSRDLPMAMVEFQIDPERPESAVSVLGNFWFAQLEAGQWQLDLRSGVYPDCLLFRGAYEEGEERFDYEILLRPWGRLWDDLDDGDGGPLPFRYKWYLAMVNDGKPMPDRLPPVE